MTDEPSAPGTPSGAPTSAETGYAPSGVAEPEYPARLDVEHQGLYARLLPLVKWLLAIPHYIVLSVLAIVAFVVIVVAFFATVISGRYPRGTFDFLVGVLRWSANVSAYVNLMTDRYPPFSLTQVNGYPVTFDVAYPQDGRIARWRPILHWLLVIPFGIVAYAVAIVGSICVFLGLFAILVTKKFPRDLFDIVLVSSRWQIRAAAYVLWMTPRYPPFVWA